MQHNTGNNSHEIIRIVSKYVIKRAFRLFDAETRVKSLQQFVDNLRLTSKHFKNDLCDEISLEITHRWMKGRDREDRTSKRIEKKLENNDPNIFNFMDLVSKVFSPRDSARYLGKYLITITQNHRSLLQEYMEFFKSRSFHMTVSEYHSQPRNFPFPGFKPELVEKSMQIANENGWIDECLMLFNYFAANLLLERADGEDPNNPMERVREAIKSGKKLNFGQATVANKLDSILRVGIHFRQFYMSPSHCSVWVESYLDPLQLTTTDVMKVLHSPRVDANAILRANGNLSLSNLPSSDPTLSKRYRVISFVGSTIVKYSCRSNAADPWNALTHKIIPKTTKTFTGIVPKPENCQTAYLYAYHRSILENDLDRAKQFQQNHDVRIATQFVHPLDDYVQYAEQLDQKMVDYLVETFGFSPRCLQSFKQDPISDQTWQVVRPLILQGAPINTMAVWKRLFYEKIPQSKKEFEDLLNKTNPPLRPEIFFMLCEESTNHPGEISETRTLLFLAWKFGRGQNYLSTLPKEIFKLILDFTDEPPLLLQHAQTLLELQSNNSISYINLSATILASSSGPHVLRLIRDNLQKFSSVWSNLRFIPTKAVKRNISILRQLMVSVYMGRLVSDNIVKYFAKYETDENVLKHFGAAVRISGVLFPHLEYAAIYNNTNYLHVFYKQPLNRSVVLSQKKIDSISLKRRTKISFQEAKEIVDKVRSLYL